MREKFYIILAIVVAMIGTAACMTVAIMAGEITSFIIYGVTNIDMMMWFIVIGGIVSFSFSYYLCIDTLKELGVKDISIREYIKGRWL